MSDHYSKESEFENDLIHLLYTKYRWSDKVLRYKTKDELARNWADNLLRMNWDELKGKPLSDSELNRLIDELDRRKTPFDINDIITGTVMSLNRDNGEHVKLTIFNRLHIGGGKTEYQIAQQPIFEKEDPEDRDHRGDFTLLINGMPVVHVELKKSGTSWKVAANQIESYSKKRVFSGIFRFVQIFVAMTPEEMRYFANPGEDIELDRNFCFEWKDSNNVPCKGWRDIAEKFLSIPHIHYMIAYFTVADDGDGKLKVLRSYQYYATREILKRAHDFSKRWDEPRKFGGYVWHTTGSGKTMTSFKAAQLIRDLGYAHKIVFLVDRLELGTQSGKEYRNFADDPDEVQDTESTRDLIRKLKSDNSMDALIITSIQKMSRVTEAEGLSKRELEKLNSKHIVFIIDECHRSVSGSGSDGSGMLISIRQSYPTALMFGFTGTPILDRDGGKHLMTTPEIFGDELHRYTIAHGIEDENVLGFDITKVETFRERDLRQKVALMQSDSQSEQEALSDPQKKKIYLYYMEQASMVTVGNEKGIEELLGRGLYRNNLKHQQAVVKDIKDNWNRLTQLGRFHGILATSRIVDAIRYYRLLKQEFPELRVAALFDLAVYDDDSDPDDPDNNHDFKEAGLLESIKDYNSKYGTSFSLSTVQSYKKDLSARMAHKYSYRGIEMTPEKQLDLVIVVNQLLTGYDSKWVNTVFLDKTMTYEYIIQTFSRTNRICGFDKRAGNIRYYRMPHTMKANIDAALDRYSGENPYCMLVDKLGRNIEAINYLYSQIRQLFLDYGIPEMDHLPDDPEAIDTFSKLFVKLNKHLLMAEMQGFSLDQKEYVLPDQEEDN